MIMRPVTGFGPIILGVALLALAGCGESGPKRYGVSGTVKFHGEPVKLGSINFQADDGASGGAQITDGKYAIPAAAGLTVGKYKVAVSYPDPKTAPTAEEAPGDSGAVRELLPEKYADGSELTAEIKAESNTVDFDLK